MANKFVKVRCNGCKNEQIVYSRATTHVKCLICGIELTNPTGGKANIKAHVLETI
jgi:small subunit ribosomal protein S27e